MLILKSMMKTANSSALGLLYFHETIPSVYCL